MKQYEPVIGLEVHAELATQSKMFCTCKVVDAITAEPNTSVCPVCAGMPGVLPVVNAKAVEYAVRVGLALGCKIAETSLFDRKNYFYPDLPKGYQISQYEYPVASNGKLVLQTSQGEKTIRIRRAHLEEDTGKLTHNNKGDESYSTVDLNRAGVPLLEIVTEPDFRTLEEVRLYAQELRAILRYLGVNSGDMEKGVIRFEANISLRPTGSQELGTRTEIKNLNSFRSMERAISYEIERQQKVLEAGEAVLQETVGWDEDNGVTFSQRGKEDAHDYRYFPEPDLPPLVLEKSWIDKIAVSLPELPRPKAIRFQKQFNISETDALLLANERATSDYFELSIAAANNEVDNRMIANWITGELFSWLNQSSETIDSIQVSPVSLVELLKLLTNNEINQNTAKKVLAEMLKTGKTALKIVEERGLKQVSDENAIADWIKEALTENPQEVESFLAGKETLANWFFGQVMKKARGKANPQVVREELERQLEQLKQA